MEELPSIAGTQFFNVDPAWFINPQDQSISRQDMYDFLHLTKRGYHKIMDPLLEEVQTLLKNFLTADVASTGDVDTN